MQLTTDIYARQPVLCAKSDEQRKQYQIHFAQMLNMATDSDKFVELSELETREGAWRVAGNAFKSAKGGWLPVFEGKMVQAFDHRASDIVISADNLFRPGQGENVSADDHANPNRAAQPRCRTRQASRTSSSG